MGRGGGWRISASAIAYLPIRVVRYPKLHPRVVLPVLEAVHVEEVVAEVVVGRLLILQFIYFLIIFPFLSTHLIVAVPNDGATASSSQVLVHGQQLGPPRPRRVLLEVLQAAMVVRLRGIVGRAPPLGWLEEVAFDPSFDHLLLEPGHLAGGEAINKWKNNIEL
jgi:hypothetical protein